MSLYLLHQNINADLHKLIVNVIMTSSSTKI